MSPWIEALRAFENVPVSNCVEQIVAILRTQLLFAPVAADPNTVGGSVQFLTGKDALGNVWMYLYSGKQSLVQAGLADQAALSRSFDTFFEIAHQNGFGGLAVFDDDGKMVALLPAEYFERAQAALN